MPTRLLRAPRTNQPQDGFEPSAEALEAGLVFAAIPGYPTRNLVNNKARVSTVGGGLVQSTGFGGITWNSSTSTPVSDRYDFAPGAAYTLVAIFVDSAGSGSLRSFACSDDASLARALQFRISASNVVELIGFNTGVTASTATGPSGAPSSTNPSVAVGTLGADKVLRAYLNGMTGTSATITGTVQTFSVIDLLARVSSGAATNGFPGRLLGFFGFNRELPPQMVRDRLQSAEAAWGFIAAPTALPANIPAASGTTHNTTITETVSLADTVAAVSTFVAALLESAASADAVVATQLAAAAITESVTATDALAAVAAVSAALSEPATVSDVLAAVSVAQTALSESVAAAETVTTGPVVTADLTESVTTVDALAAAAVWVAALTEAAVSADTATASAVLAAVLVEAATAGDTTTAASPTSHTVSVTELVVALDLVAAAIAGAVTGDADTTFIVPADTRTFVVPADTRTFIVPAD